MIDEKQIEEFAEAALDDFLNGKAKTPRLLARIYKRRVERNAKVKQRLLDRLQDRIKKDWDEEKKLKEFGDGEFMKWLIEWFSSEGYKIILEFIKGIISVIV